MPDVADHAVKLKPLFVVADTATATPGWYFVPPPGQFGAPSVTLPAPDGDTACAIATHAWKPAVTLLSAFIVTLTGLVDPPASPLHPLNA